MRPRLNTVNQESLPSFVVAQASGISANKKGTNSVFFVKFSQIFSVRFSRLNVRIPCLRQKVMKMIPRQKTLSGRTSLLRPYKGIPPPPRAQQRISSNEGRQ